MFEPVRSQSPLQGEVRMKMARQDVGDGWEFHMLVKGWWSRHLAHKPWTMPWQLFFQSYVPECVELSLATAAL